MTMGIRQRENVQV